MSMKKLLSIVLAAAMLFAAVVPVFASDDVSYEITDPYASVDWDSWHHYKAQLHSHTLYSDGEMSIADVVEAYYARDYDILAVTDHGVVNTGWNKAHKTIPIIGYNKIIKPGQVVPMSDERYEQITTGADRDGRPMLDVEQGIEMNAMNVRKNHVNGFFCGWGQGWLGAEEDYETAIAKTEEAGGVSFINHPADYLYVNHDLSRASDQSQLKIFTDSLLAHPSCLGVEAFNCRDTVDRYGRVVWDNLLMYCIPRGRNVWAFSNDDSHYESQIGLTAEIMLMPELSNAALRTAMENGSFFACSILAREEMGDEFEGSGNFAFVSSVDVDDDNDVITVSAENYDTIEWIADGEIIATGESLDLRAHSDEIGSYVRFQIKNEGGLLLSQPFVCDDGDMESHLIPEPVDERSAIVRFFDAIISFFRRSLLGEALYCLLVLDR